MTCCMCNHLSAQGADLSHGCALCNNRLRKKSYRLPVELFRRMDAVCRDVPGCSYSRIARAALLAYRHGCVPVQKTGEVHSETRTTKLCIPGYLSVEPSQMAPILAAYLDEKADTIRPQTTYAPPHDNYILETEK